MIYNKTISCNKCITYISCKNRFQNELNSYKTTYGNPKIYDAQFIISTIKHIINCPKIRYESMQGIVRIFDLQTGVLGDGL